MTLVTGVDHIALAVKDLEKALDFYVRVLGLKVTHQEEMAEEGVRVAFVDAGGLSIELMEPLSEDSFIARQIKKNGQGVAHLCFATDDAEALAQELESQELWLLKPRIRSGAQGRKAVFLHPKDNSGLLTEFAQMSDKN